MSLNRLTDWVLGTDLVSRDRRGSRRTAPSPGRRRRGGCPGWGAGRQLGDVPSPGFAAGPIRRHPRGWMRGSPEPGRSGAVRSACLVLPPPRRWRWRGSNRGAAPGAGGRCRARRRRGRRRSSAPPRGCERAIAPIPGGDAASGWGIGALTARASLPGSRFPGETRHLGGESARSDGTRAFQGADSRGDAAPGRGIGALARRGSRECGCPRHAPRVPRRRQHAGEAQLTGRRDSSFDFDFVLAPQPHGSSEDATAVRQGKPVRGGSDSVARSGNLS
jgi:hypothetical protein